MVKKSPVNEPTSPLTQIVLNFVIPAIILMRLSPESQLGPAKAMLLALAFPVALELYSVYKRRKFSVLSLIAIGGILITGAISLLGLSENWLALRRSVPYFAISAALLISMLVKRPLVDMALPRIIDMDRIKEAARKNNAVPALKKYITRCSYMLSVLFIIIGLASYILTLVVITSHTDTASFNSEFVRLRVISLPAITLPLLIGFVGILLYFFAKIEKITGIEANDLLKKKKN